jgi:hypothetical protein
MNRALTTFRVELGGAAYIGLAFKSCGMKARPAALQIGALDDAFFEFPKD